MTDIPGDSSTSAVLTVGTQISSAIDATGDHDWYKITLAAGQTITITATGGGNLDTYLNLYDPTGTTVLASDDDIVDGVNTNSRLTFTASSAGTYFIDVGSWHDQSSGTYDLYVEPSPAPVFSYDQIAFQLTNGYWGGDVHHWAVSQGGTLTVNISTLTTAEQTLARAALQEWSDVIGVHFQEVSSGGQIVFSDAEDTTANGPVAQTDANWSSSGIISSANVQISKTWVNQYGTGLDSYSFQTYVHEIGHALGLGHAGEYNDSATYSSDALFANDSWSTSIMSYFDQQQSTYFANQSFSRLYALTPMAADIAAMQSLYGLSTTTRTGDTTYGDNSNAGGVYDASVYPRAEFAIVDSAGNDTIDYSRVGVGQLINLNPETFSNVNGLVGNLTIGPGTIIENAIGGSGADTIIGNSANNVLTGNLGNDSLTGGGGNDIFKDSESGHNGDTITDFHNGDQLIFTDASLAGFSFSLTGNVLTYTGGSLTLNGSVKGSFGEVAAPGGGVELSFTSANTQLKHVPHDDFNGDGSSDILWLNDNGTVTDWLAQSSGGFSSNSSAFQIQASSNWHIIGTGDFNGDGRVDLLWRADDGTITDWLGQANGGFTSNGTNFTINASSNWHIIATGDFNGDGIDDILWRADDGTVTNWLGQANGSFSNNWNNFNMHADSSWQIIGTGDFNGDGISDIMWRGADGTVTDWLGQPNGGFSNNFSNFNVHADASWQIVGFGDFNGDGRSDILWRSTDGTVTDWLANANSGFTSNGSTFTINASSNWHIAAIGDYNHDGIDDLLWQSDSGQVSDWFGQSNGAITPSSQGFFTSVDTHWHVAPQITVI